MEKEDIAKLRELFKSEYHWVKGAKLNSLNGVVQAIIHLATFAEKASLDGRLAKADKKALAISILNEYIDIPYLPEFAEEKLIGLAIDLVVNTINNIKGKNWGKND